jgi:hypothetical protein
MCYTYYYQSSRDKSESAASKEGLWNGKLALYEDEDLTKQIGNITWINNNSNPGVDANGTIRSCIANIATPVGVIQYPYTKTGFNTIATKSVYTAGYNQGKPVLIKREIYDNGLRKVTITDL